MSNSWAVWWHENAATLGITLAFAGLGSSIGLRAGSGNLSNFTAVAVIGSGQLVSAAVAVAAHGVFGLSPFYAPLVGLACGLLGIFLIRTVLRGGARVEQRSDDIADKGINLLPGGGGRKGEP